MTDKCVRKVNLQIRTDSVDLHNDVTEKLIPSFMAPKEHVHTHWAFSWVPLFGAFIWCGTLLAMMAAWAGIGKPRYFEQQANLPLISDVGGSFLQPLFIVGGTICAISFFASTVIERYLRHTGRLIPNTRRSEKIYSYLAIAGGFIGGMGLILLTILDTFRHTTAHRICLVIFIVGVALSAIFSICEYSALCNDFPDLRRLRLVYIAKGVIVSFLIAAAICFGATLYKGDQLMTQSISFAAAVLEWTISFVFTLYILTFWYDMHLSKGFHKGDLTIENIEANGLPRNMEQVG